MFIYWNFYWSVNNERIIILGGVLRNTWLTLGMLFVSDNHCRLRIAGPVLRERAGTGVSFEET